MPGGQSLEMKVLTDLVEGTFRPCQLWNSGEIQRPYRKLEISPQKVNVAYSLATLAHSAGQPNKLF